MDIESRAAALVTDGLERGTPPGAFSGDPFWRTLRAAGTELWLDTGDIDEAAKLWTAEMSGLTTNNTLLNKEVQKGIYDDFIRLVRGELNGLGDTEKILEIGFMLNARHGLRLVDRFGCRVSVELHTDLAHDVDRSVWYGKRYHAISPDRFIVKVPYTASGLIAARRLKEAGVPINFTLEFGARQNVIVAVFVKPDYTNVFLGRINAYVADNRLGDGRYAGEQATLASQAAVKRLSEGRTKQIAASMRNAEQLGILAGVDVYTMPPAVAAEGRKSLKAEFRDNTAASYQPRLSPDVDPLSVRIAKVWETPDTVVAYAKALDSSPPAAGAELEQRAREAGLTDMFPVMGGDDRAAIARDGKIPKHEKWAHRVKAEELAVDTLLNIAGLASFESDQAQLDDRIRGLL